MKITKSLAQEIIKKVMKVIPYNVNIMDENGLIIGSGDKERIGLLHEGALEAIHSRRMVSVYDVAGGAKPGVNIPFQFKDKIIGVIGISGDPNYVAPFAELVKITAELLINQQFMFKERRMKEQMKEEFLYQWVYRTEPYDTAFIEMSHTLDIDLTIKRIAIIIKRGELNDNIHLHPQEFLFHLNTGTFLYIVPEKSDIIKRITPLIKTNNIQIGIGNSHLLVANSVAEAKRALEFTEKLTLSNQISYYREFQFIDYLIHKEIGIDETVRCFKELDESPKGAELIETLMSFIDHNGDMNTTSQKLHIHRNSLAYRLQRIESLTSKNPKKFNDLFELYTGYLIYKIQKPS